MNKTLLKGIGSVLAGIVTGAVPAIATDVVLEKTGVFPSFAEQMEHGLHVSWMLLLALTYRLIYQALGSFVTAKLAPIDPCSTCSSVPPSVSSSVSSGPLSCGTRGLIGTQ